MKRRNRLYLLAPLAAITVAAGALVLAGSGPLQAWGDGTICSDGVTHEFDDEASYYLFLAAHPNAYEGHCITVTTTTEPRGTTSTSTTSPSSTTTSPSTTSPASSSTTSTTSPSATTTTSSTTSSTPSPPTTSASLPDSPHTTPSTVGSTEQTESAAVAPPTPSSPTVAQLPTTR